MKSPGLYFSVLLLAGANTYLWFDLVQGGPAPRAGRILGLVIMLAMGALFADKLSNNSYAPGFIRVGCILGLVVLFFVLNSQVSGIK